MDTSFDIRRRVAARFSLCRVAIGGHCRRLSLVCTACCFVLLSVGSLYPSSSSFSVAAVSARARIDHWFGRADVVLHIAAYAIVSGLLAARFWQDWAVSERALRDTDPLPPSEGYSGVGGWFQRLITRNRHEAEMHNVQLETKALAQNGDHLQHPEKRLVGIHCEHVHGGIFFPWSLFWRAFFSANLLGLALEILQASIPLTQRAFQVIDVVANGLGAALGATAILLLMSRVYGQRVLVAETTSSALASTSMV